MDPHNPGYPAQSRSTSIVSSFTQDYSSTSNSPDPHHPHSMDLVMSVPIHGSGLAPPPPTSYHSEQQQYSSASSSSVQAPPQHYQPPQQQQQRLMDNDPPAPRPLTSHEQEMISQLDRLKFFLATAPSHWGSNAEVIAANEKHDRDPIHYHPALNRFLLPSGEYVSCVLWGGLYHVTGTDIVRALVFRFEAFARPVRNMKKFEEGVFSDLRNLKPGNDACLEEPKSPFLDLLFKYQCIRTQKKQKVFYWFSVPHDRLFLDALERDLKRERMGMEPTTAVVGEPARSFRYDPKRSLYEQFSKARGGVEGEGDLERVVREADLAESSNQPGNQSDDEYLAFDDASQHRKSMLMKTEEGAGPSQFHSMFTLFEGSPTYKLRRKKGQKGMTPMSNDPIRRISAPNSASYDREAFSPYAHRRPGDQIVHQSSTLSVPLSAPIRPPSSSNVPQIPQIPQVPQVPNPHPSLAPTFQQHPSSQRQTQVPMSAPAHMMQFAHDRFHDQNDVRPSSANRFEQGHQRVDQGPPIGDSLEQKTKAFACPLFSCGRLFKRMEHLKRHLRVHTAERPFQCNRCQKRFSRSDNLNQHYRTHARADGGDSTAGVKLESGDEEETMMEANIRVLEVSEGEAEDVDTSYSSDNSVPLQAPVPAQAQSPAQSHASAHLNAQYVAPASGLQEVALYYPPGTMQSEYSQHSQEAVSVHENEAVVYDGRPQFAYGNEARVQAQQMQYVEAQSVAPLVCLASQQQAQWARPHVQLDAYGAESPYSAVSQSISGSPPHASGSLRHSIAESSPVSRYESPSTMSYNGDQRTASICVSAIPSAHPAYIHASATTLSAPSHKLAFDHPALHNANLHNITVRRHRSVTPSASLSRSISVGPNVAEARRTSWHTNHHGHSRYHPYPASGHGPTQFAIAQAHPDEPATPNSAVTYATTSEYEQPALVQPTAQEAHPTYAPPIQESVQRMASLELQQHQAAQQEAVYEQQPQAVQYVVEEPQMQVVQQVQQAPAYQASYPTQNLIALSGDMYAMNPHHHHHHQPYHQPMDEYTRAAAGHGHMEPSLSM